MIKNILVIAMVAISSSNVTLPTFSQEIRDDPLIYQPNPDSPILSRNPSLSGQGEAFDFLIGDWDVVITWEPANKPKDIYKAKWHNHWVIDGHVVMQEWRGPSLTGAEFRFFDTKTKNWTGRNIYVDGAWRETKAVIDGDNLIVTIFGHNKARGDFLNRETYYNISKNNFEMKSDISLDNGKSWQKGDYHMVVARTVEN